MITLTGKLRQASTIQMKEKAMRKLWVETETQRDNGVADLDLHQFLLDTDKCSLEPAPGSPVTLSVRPYVMAGNLRFSALSILSATLTPEMGTDADKGQKNAK